MKKLARTLMLGVNNTKEKRIFLLAIITSIVYSVMLIFTPFFLSMILDGAEKNSIFGLQYNVFLVISVLFIYCILTMVLFIISKKAVNTFVLNSKLNIEKAVIKDVMASSMNTSGIINIFNNDIVNFCNKYCRSFFKLLTSTSFIIIGLILIAFINIYAFLLETFFLAGAFIIHVIYRSKLSRRYDEYREQKEKSLKGISSFLNGKLTIKSNDAFSYADENVSRLIKQKAKSESFYNLLLRKSDAIIMAIPIVTTLFMSIAYSKMISKGMVNKNMALAGTYVAGYIIWELIHIIPMINNMASVSSVQDRIIKAFENKDSFNDAVGSNDEAVNRITVNNLNVIIDDRVILNEINLSFDTTKKYLIIGNSGCGKTTLINSFIGLNDYNGTISDDSSDGNAYKYQINYLPQKVETFPGSIGLNISIEEEVNEKEVLDVINKATYGNCNINNEFDATTSTQSGGELKKIAFARALYHQKKHPIMVMDEPFEGLDLASKKEIEKQILQHEGMALVVSHIFDRDFVEKMDEIIIIEDGSVVYSGCYSNIPSLLKKHYFDWTV